MYWKSPRRQRVGGARNRRSLHGFALVSVDLMGIKARLEALATQAPAVLDSLTVHVDRQ
jgi:hypothetical protein